MEPKTARRSDDRQAEKRAKAYVVPVVERASVRCNAHSTVLTLAGEKPADALQPGDKVITRDSGTAVLRAARHQTVVCDAVLIKAGSLGHTRPPENAILPMTAQLLLRDWRAQALFGRAQAVTDVGRLCDGEFISALPNHQMDLVELVFDKPHILYIAGLEVACAPETSH